MIQRISSQVLRQFKSCNQGQPLFSFSAVSGIKRQQSNLKTEINSDLLKSFGRGEIPQSLNFDRPYSKFFNVFSNQNSKNIPLISQKPIEQSQTSNGIRVCSETFPSNIITVSVFINCGSRNETQDSSGAAHFLQHIHFQGTSKRNRQQLELEVENMGGQLNAYTSRENTCFVMNVFKDKLEPTIQFFADLMCNSLLENLAVENERDTIYRELLQTQKQEMETTMEFSHRSSYQDHQMGLPILGLKENIYQIKQDQIVNYKNENYFGENMVIVGCGNYEHSKLVELIETHFQQIPRKSPLQNQKNQEKPVFQQQIFLQENQVPQGVNIGLFYEAASWLSPQYYNFLLIQRILGDQSMNPLEVEFSRISQTNYFQSQLPKFNQITAQRSLYTPYRDTALFGNYFAGTPDSFQQCEAVNQLFLQSIQNVRDEEIERAKRRIYIELLQHESTNDISQAIGNHVLYLNRRIFRTQIAYRIASLTKENIKQTIQKLKESKGFSITVWGKTKPFLQYLNQ